MTMKKLLLAGGLAVLMTAGFHRSASAQDCREHCLLSCPDPTQYQSSGGGNKNGWSGACSYAFCGQCGSGELVKEHTAASEAILDQVRQGSPSDMKAVVRTYGKYMLVQVDRQLLVLKGLSCDPNGLGAVVPLSREKIDALREAGVQDMAEFVSTRDHK